MKWRPKGGKPLAVGCNAMLGINSAPLGEFLEVNFKSKNARLQL